MIKTKFVLTKHIHQEEEKQVAKKYDKGVAIFFHWMGTKNCSNRWMIVCEENKYPQERSHNLFVSWHYTRGVMKAKLRIQTKAIEGNAINRVANIYKYSVVK